MGGVGLERIGKGGAHSPIPEISPKLFLLQQNNTAYLLARTVWICAWLTVDELWHPLFVSVRKKLLTTVAPCLSNLTLLGSTCMFPFIAY